MCRRRHQRLPGPGRGGQYDVAAREQLEDCLLLVRIQREPLRLGVRRDPVVRRVAHLVTVTERQDRSREPAQIRLCAAAQQSPRTGTYLHVLNVKALTS